MYVIVDVLGVGVGEMFGDLLIKFVLNVFDVEVEFDIMMQVGVFGEGLEGVCVSFVCLLLGWVGEVWYFCYLLDFEGLDCLWIEGWEVVCGFQIILGVLLWLMEEQWQVLLLDVVIIVVSLWLGLSDVDLDVLLWLWVLVFLMIGVGVGDLGGLCCVWFDCDEWCNV